MKRWEDFGISVSASATGEVATTCPECSPKRKKQNVKCLSVNVDKAVWWCGHCGWSGTLKDGVKDKSDPDQWRPKEWRKPNPVRITDLPPAVVDWFSKRGITETVLKRNGIGYEKVYMPQLEDYATAIRFPFFRNGETVNVKSRDGQKNFRLESGAERIFYGMDDVTGDTAVIVEGEIDKLSLEVAGITHTISVPDGAPSPTAKDYTKKFDFLENCGDFLGRIKTFILAVDNDEPGKVLEEELARRLGKERCKRVTWPQGCKDANEVLKEYGAVKLQECIKAAEYYPVVGVFDVRSLCRNIDLLYEEGMQRAERLHLGEIDKLYTVSPGQWTLITGIPGHGKSEFLDMILWQLATMHGWQHAIFSPENQPLELHVAKLLEKHTGKPFFKNRDVYRMTRDEMYDNLPFLDKHFTFILPPEDQLTVDGILDIAKVVVLRKGIKGIVIDPWNELEHSRANNLTETEYISAALSKIRRFARHYGVHVWLVAHPAKMKKDNNGDYPVPTPYDISGSAHWRNKADNCITVYRDFDTGKVDVHVQKIRFKHNGKVGVASFNYDTISGRYTPEVM